MQRLKEILGVSLLASLVATFAGCGGYSYKTPTPPGNTFPQITTIDGRYNLLLTAASGQVPATTAIYTVLTETDTTLTAAAATLICPLNDPSQCVDASIAPTGTISDLNVTILISFPDPAGANVVTLVGAVTAGLQAGSLSGTYTDTLGRSGSWTGSVAAYQYPTAPNPYDFIGTFNSTSNPLPIPLTISLQLALTDLDPPLTGSATVMNWPCGVSMTLEGQALGDAFDVSDTTNKVRIIAVPPSPTSNDFTFIYKFDPAAPHCAGDAGRGDLTILNPWDY